MTPPSSWEVAEAAALACLLEVAAPKPGNVSRYADLPGLRLAGFLASAPAIVPAMAAAGTQPVGATILQAITATRRRVDTNTNLGIVLLLAPLATAALLPLEEPRPVGQAAAPVAPHQASSSEDRGGPSPAMPALRRHVAAVLAGLTVEDARQTYQAIRLAMPGGLGEVADQDVAGEPTLDLRAVMALAAQRDAVAREYVTDYATTFELVYPALRRYLDAGLDGAGATVGTYLELLAAQPDSLIVRRHGPARAAEVSRRAAEVLAAGGTGTAAGWAAIAGFDSWLRAERPPLNPGTSADLVTAALFVALLDGAPLLSGGR